MLHSLPFHNSFSTLQLSLLPSTCATGFSTCTCPIFLEFIESHRFHSDLFLQQTAILPELYALPSHLTFYETNATTDAAK
jgi:hypothetical protein